MNEMRLAIGGALPEDDSDTTGPIDCAVCGTPLTPHPTGNLFTELDCWWVCDDCGRTQAPEQYALLQRLRAIAGDVLLRQVDYAEVVKRGRTDVGICPRCGADFQDDLPGVAHGRWMAVDSLTDRPLCVDCTATLPEEIQDVQRELEKERANA